MLQELLHQLARLLEAVNHDLESAGEVVRQIAEDPSSPLAGGGWQPPKGWQPPSQGWNDGSGNSGWKG